MERRVRERAYALWEAEGRPHGRNQEHWSRAVAEFASASPPPTTAPATKSSVTIASVRQAPAIPAMSIPPLSGNETLSSCVSGIGRSPLANRKPNLPAREVELKPKNRVQKWTGPAARKLGAHLFGLRIY